jgi:hypothetical protein
MQKETTVAQSIHKTDKEIRSLSLAEIEAVSGAQRMEINLPHLGMKIFADGDCYGATVTTGDGSVTARLSCDR